MLPKGFASIIEHLHRNSPTGFTPGTAITGGDKNQMVFWVPGRKRHSQQSVLRAYSNAKLFGLAPVAYKDVFAPKNEQDVYINYLALDIDSKDLNISKEEAVEILLTKNRAYQVRLSTSGNGLHAFLVLEEPIFAKKEEVKSIYTQLTQPLVDELPFKVDKADLRILYVYGKIKEIYNKLPPGYLPSKLKLQEEIFSYYVLMMHNYKDDQSHLFNLVHEKIDFKIEELKNSMLRNNISESENILKEIELLLAKIPRAYEKRRILEREIILLTTK